MTTEQNVPLSSSVYKKASHLHCISFSLLSTHFYLVCFIPSLLWAISTCLTTASNQPHRSPFCMRTNNMHHLHHSSSSSSRKSQMNWNSRLNQLACILKTMMTWTCVLQEYDLHGQSRSFLGGSLLIPMRNLPIHTLHWLPMPSWLAKTVDWHWMTFTHGSQKTIPHFPLAMVAGR